MARVLVLGGYGVFGARAVERLLRDPGLKVIVAGRDAAKAAAKCAELSGHTSRVEAQRLDASSLTAVDLKRLAVDIVINTVGPFQGQDYRVARAAIAARCHYIDLADARDFVCGIAALDAEARAADVLVVSGASSVPALAAAVIDHLQQSVGLVENVTYGISPGNSFDPGEATVASILAGVGKPLSALVDGRMQTVHGWQPLASHRAPNAGTRWLGACDVPDLTLFPERYPSLRTQRFLAGVEVKLFHGGLWALSWLVRWRLLPGLERMAHSLIAVKRRLHFLGSDRGLMFMRLQGRSSDGGRRSAEWTLVAFKGHGPFIPATPAVIIARAIANGRQPLRGAMPCLDLMTLADFSNEVADLDIRQTIT